MQNQRLITTPTALMNPGQVAIESALQGQPSTAQPTLALQRVSLHRTLILAPPYERPAVAAPSAGPCITGACSKPLARRRDIRRAVRHACHVSAIGQRQLPRRSSVPDLTSGLDRRVPRRELRPQPPAHLEGKSSRNAGASLLSHSLLTRAPPAAAPQPQASLPGSARYRSGAVWCRS